MTRSQPPLDATAAERLVRLRLMLSEAEQRAEESTSQGTHLALILLDGACELAMGLALGRLGEQVPKSFQQIFDRLSKTLDTAWDKKGWKGVSDLHEMRNEAQHRGTRVDQSELPPWAIDAEMFTRSLIAASYGVELSDIAVSSVVLNEEVRRLLERAEATLANDAKASVEMSLEALSLALSKWEAERMEAGERLRRNHGLHVSETVESLT